MVRRTMRESCLRRRDLSPVADRGPGRSRRKPPGNLSAGGSFLFSSPDPGRPIPGSGNNAADGLIPRLADILNAGRGAARKAAPLSYQEVICPDTDRQTPTISKGTLP